MNYHNKNKETIILTNIKISIKSIFGYNNFKLA